MSTPRLILIVLSTWCTFQLLSASPSVAGHKCNRKCESGKPPMTCHYEFNLELYASMSGECADCPSIPEACFKPGCIPADGHNKALYLINRQLPGPAIEVCKGDRIIVDLKNDLATETTSIHWHGVHQRQSPFMDGVPYVTQCPIPPGHSFRYDFIADRAGSNMWHSHSNDQRASGMFGPLVVRAPLVEDPVRQFYDRDEHVVIINDWTTEPMESVYIQAVLRSADIHPHTILVNGLARNHSDSSNSSAIRMPSSVFNVEKGYNYRFRLINAGVDDCPIRVSVDNHTLLVVSADGRDIEPIRVDVVRMLSGERYDVIISANQSIDNYWIRFGSKDGSYSPCEQTETYQVAILRYKGAPTKEPVGPVEFDIPNYENLKVLNPFNKGQESPDENSIPTLNSLEEDDFTSLEPDHKFFIVFDYIDLNDRTSNVTKKFKVKKNSYLRNMNVPNTTQPKTLWTLNHINFKAPAFPLLTQPEMIKPNQFCSYSENMKHCLKEYCSCTQTLKANLNSVVELILVDEGRRSLNHVLHLHGYHFRVVAMEKVNTSVTVEEVKQMDEEGKIKRKLHLAPFKDTVMVPTGGYTVVRFYANNPGYWLFHCHYEVHSDNGMALLFKVGEHHEFLKPPVNFPRCSSYNF